MFVVDPYMFATEPAVFALYASVFPGARYALQAPKTEKRQKKKTRRENGARFWYPYPTLGPVPCVS